MRCQNVKLFLREPLPPRIIFFAYAEIGQVSEPARLRKDHLWTDTI